MSAIASPSAASTRSRTPRGWHRADAAFVGLLALGALVVIAETRGLTFFGDEWDFVVTRRGLSPHVLLNPHGPHLSLVPILVFKALLKLFGGGSYVPFRLLAAFDLVIVALVLGIICRRHWGPWWGLAPVLLLVTLGPGGVTILWPFQDGYALAVAFGLLALIVLERGGRWADPICCLALLISLGSASQGIGFVVGAGIMIVLRGNWRRRAWVVAVPVVLYLAWYAKYAHQHSETHLSLWGTSLSYIMQSLSATAAGTAGLSSVSPQTGTLDITFGVPIAIAFVFAIAAAARRGWRPGPIFWGCAATLVVVWFAASLSNSATIPRPPNDPRYLSSDAALLMVCVCAAVPAPRLARTGTIVALVVLAVVAATNAHQYGQQRDFFLAGARAQRAELGALDIARPVVSPVYNPGVVDANLANIQARPFFSASDAFGLREDSPTQILAAPESTRASADRVLAGAELSLAPTSALPRAVAPAPPVLGGAANHSGGCLVLGASPVFVRANPGTLTVQAPRQNPVTIAMGRFASNYAVALGTVPAGTVATVRVPRDDAPQVLWRMTLAGPEGRVCVVSG